MDTNGIELTRRRRHCRDSEEFKEPVIQGCRHLGVSVAAIVLPINSTRTCCASGAGVRARRDSANGTPTYSSAACCKLVS